MQLDSVYLPDDIAGQLRARCEKLNSDPGRFPTFNAAVIEVLRAGLDQLAAEDEFDAPQTAPVPPAL